MDRLLLHVCCAPCSTAVIERLKNEYELGLYFYNPNIHPQKEYFFRLRELMKFAAQSNIPVIEADYPLKQWFRLVAGKEKCSERSGERCEICISTRLLNTAEKAAEQEYLWFASTLSVSPHKNVEQINRLGEAAAKHYGIKFLPADFKKNNGFQNSITLSREQHMYRQNYCGCVFSMLERKARDKA
ncbi:MAG: epoxyqueuosine reductase QueH [Candidatus Margulisbacteria bacterium]|nr:epoxyqueuosine reductase QueH [Candidatus Margulisiibacteriota bacterium]